MTPQKKSIIVLLALTLTVIALRETPLVDLNFYQSNTSTSFHSTLNTSSSFVSWGDAKEKPAPAVNIKDYLSIVIILGKDTLYKHQSKFLPIVVKIQEFHTGQLWTPIYKSASFSAVGIPGFDQRQRLKIEYPTGAYKIGMSGQLAIKGKIVIKGFCSHKQAVKLVKEQIVEKFRSKITEELAALSPEYLQAMSNTSRL
jgi:hypothetical protein